MARSVGSVPTLIWALTFSVPVLSTATVPRAGLSTDVEFTTSAAVPLLFSSIGPAFRLETFGKIFVIGTKATTLPVATLTTDTPPKPDTQARVPLFAKAIDTTGPDFVTEIARTIFWLPVLITQIRPDWTEPTQIILPPGAAAADWPPAGSLIVFSTVALLVRTTATRPSLPPAVNIAT